MQSHHVYDRRTDIEDSLLSVHEAIEILGGKWKIPILLNLACGRKRFSQIKETIQGLSSRILSKELKQLEEHRLIVRYLDDESGVFYYSIVQNNFTAVESLIEGLREWGDQHRSTIFHRDIHTNSITKFVESSRSVTARDHQTKNLP